MITSWTWSWSKNSFNASFFRVLVLFKLCDSRRLFQLTQWGVSVRHCFKFWKIILLTPQISIRGQFILNWSDYHKTNTARDIYFVLGDPGILESQPGLLFEERLYTTVSVAHKIMLTVSRSGTRAKYGFAKIINLNCGV